MAVLAVVGLVAAGAALDRSGDAAGRSGLPFIGLTLSGNDVAHFERIYDRLPGGNSDSPFYRENNRWRRAQLRYDGNGLQRTGEESWPDSGLPLGRA